MDELIQKYLNKVERIYLDKGFNLSNSMKKAAGEIGDRD